MKRTPLYEKHISSGAKMVDFAGWEMPVYYTGIIEEHMHTRNKAGIFDICHMGELFLKGKDSAKAVERLVSCRIDDMPDGKCRYGFFLSQGGGIMDDLIVFRISRDEFMIVVNAGTTEKDASWVAANISGDVVFSNLSEDTAKIDVQGPLSSGIIRDLTGSDIVDGISRYSFVNVKIGEADVLLARTGYTGEIGYELFFNRTYAVKIWERLISFDVIKPIGLGARDTLRLEMGYPLYGNDIDENVTPFGAGLERFVYMEKDFIGKEALISRRGEQVEKVLFGFECSGRRIARHGFDVEINGRKSGTVTSGAFSPCLKKAIGLCYVEKDMARDGAKVVLSDGKIHIEAELRKGPFLRQDKGISSKKEGGI